MNINKSYILAGREDKYDIPKTSFGKIIFDHLRNRSPNEVINIDAITKEVLTCGKLLEDSIKLATVLKNFGIEKGDVIAIVSENSINYVIPMIAGFYMGVTVNPLNPGYSVGELKHGLFISKAKLIFSSESALETVLKVQNELKFIQTVIHLGPRSNNSNVICLENLLEATSVSTNNFKPSAFDSSEEVAFIVSSSGTTGLPKGVMITHENLRIPISFMGHSQYGNTTMKDTTIIVVPFFHIYGPLLQILTIVTSMKSIILDKFKPDIFLKCIQEYKATKLFLVPTLVQFLTKSPLVDKYDTSSVKDILVGTAPLGKELQDEASRRLGGASIRQIYGLTETAGPCTLQTDNKKAGSVGVLVPGAIAKIRNPDTNEIVGPLITGEICLKGPMVMKGYIPNQDCFDEDGFFLSGDVGFYDHDGFFYIVDRMKEIIKYKGFQVSPAELEALIITHHLVEDCGVIGIPDERAGEVPLAFVVLKADVIATEQQIADFVAERISIQKRLYGGVRFVEEIPRTPSGKIIRRKLVEMFRNSN